MLTSYYRSREDAYRMEILPVLGDFADDFDQDTLVDRLVVDTALGYHVPFSPSDADYHDALDAAEIGGKEC